MDYRMNVTFVHADTTYFNVPGYYAADGNAAETSANSGNVWEVLFSPDRPGQWTYTVSFRTGNEVAVSSSTNAGTATHFDGATGNFNIVSSDKFQPDHRSSGRVSYVGKRYRQHQGTGDYFIRGGSDSPENLLNYEDFDNTPNIDNLRKKYLPHVQDWNSGDPTWQTTKGKGLIGAINYLSSKGVNAISFLTMGHNGDDENVYPWVDPTEPTVYDVSKLAQWEIIFEHADHKGIFLHFKTAETENDGYLDNGELGPERKLYYRELMARFGHHLALNWNIGEEMDQSTARQQAYIQYFDDNDPYKHLVVIHTKSNQIATVLTPLLGTGSQLTGYSMNTNWDNVHTETQKWVELSEAAGRPWSVANTEQNPAGKGILPDSGYQSHSGTTVPTAHDTRHTVIWGNLMAGGSGVEYYYGYNYVENDLTLQDFRSRDRLFEYTSIALGFFRTYLPFEEMINMDSLIGNPQHNNSKYCFGKLDEIYAVYLPDGGTVDLDLGTGGGITYSVKWFNPRTGGALLDGSVTSVSNTGSVNLGNPPSSPTEDWVILVQTPQTFQPVKFDAFCVQDSASAAQIQALLVSLGIITTTTNCSGGNNGCTTPIVSAGPDQTLGCGQSTVTLYGSVSGSGTYSWTGPNGFTSTQQNPTVSDIGTYYLTGTTGAGCDATDAVDVIQGSGQPPVANAGTDVDLDCTSGTITLDGSKSDPGSYSWTGPNGFTSTQQNPTVSDIGTYTLTVTATNGCTDSDDVVVSSCQQSCSGNAVTHFVLIDANTDLPIIDPLPDGAVIDLGVTGNDLNIEVITMECGTTVASVEMSLTGASTQSKTENKAPYALFGDQSGDFFSWTPNLGAHSLTAVPYSSKSGSGTAGTGKTISFTVVDNSTQATPPPSTIPNGGLGQNLKTPKLEVMPNPFQNKKFKVNLTGNFGNTLDVKVYSINGQLLYQEKRPYTNLFEIDLGAKGITDGIYQLRVNDKTKLIQSKSGK